MATGLIPEMMLNIVNLYAPAGTAMPFQQSFAPLGWAATNPASDSAMRVIAPGAFAGITGVTGFSGLMRGTAVTDGHILTIAELAVHNHTDSGHGHVATDSGHSHSINPGSFNFQAAAGSSTVFVQSSSSSTQIGTANVGIASGTANIQNTGSGVAHTHGLTSFNYLTIDFIVGVKS